MKKNNKTTGNYPAAIHNHFSKSIIRNIKVELKKQFTVKEFSKLVASVSSFCIVLRITNIWVPLRAFLTEHAREASVALIIYFVVYITFYLFISAIFGILLGMLEALFQYFISIRK